MAADPAHRFCTGDAGVLVRVASVSVRWCWCVCPGVWIGAVSHRGFGGCVLSDCLVAWVEGFGGRAEGLLVVLVAWIGLVSAPGDS